MLRDYATSAGDYHRMYLHDAEERAKLHALRQEAKNRRLRATLGHKLIAIGERLVENRSTELGALDTAA